MASDSGRSVKGVNRKHDRTTGVAGQCNVGNNSQQTERLGLESEHKSNTRRVLQRNSLSSQIDWLSFSPMFKQAFMDQIVLPRALAYRSADRHGPSDPESLVRSAPPTWISLGRNFQHAFLNKVTTRSWARRSDICEYPERDTSDPANDPCRVCEHMICVCLVELQRCDLSQYHFAAKKLCCCFQEYTMLPRLLERQARAAQIMNFRA